MNARTIDSTFMARALDLARRGQGLTSPNPCVGAVLVQRGKIIGEGWHRRAGSPHAEVNAVRQALRRSQSLRGATLYVTLEPCCTCGRTPPCTDLIIRERISRVVVAATDPNPAHAGRGFAILREQGIKVTAGVKEAEAHQLNRGFNHWIVHRRPWVIAKAALSLDGRMGVRPGDDPWLTGRQARRRTHELRARVDAILVGAETIRQDDPALTVRLSSFRGKTQPWRVILCRSGRLPRDHQVFTDEHRDRTIIYSRQDWSEILQDLGQRGVTSVLIEGGGQVLGQALDGGWVHELAFFLAPVVLGSANPGIVSASLRRRFILQPMFLKLGQDFMVSGVLG